MTLVALALLALLSNATLRDAQAAEQAAEPARAVALYRQALAHEKDSRLARRMRARLAWLEARSEGDYRPLAALMRMQTHPRAALAREELDAFARAVAEFPEGIVRREAHALLAGAYLDRFDDPAAALRHYEAWLASPGIDEAERRLAVAGVARTRARLEGEDAALRHLEQAGFGDRTEAVVLRAKQVGRAGTWVALVVVASFALAGIALGGWRGVLRVQHALSLRRLVIAGYVLLVPLVLVAIYDTRLARPFGTVIAAMGAVVLACAVIGAASLDARRRRMLAGLGAAATLAAGFLALHHTRLLFDIMLAIEQAG